MMRVTAGPAWAQAPASPVRRLALPLEQAAGGLREDFFALAMREAGIAMHNLQDPRGHKTRDLLKVFTG